MKISSPALAIFLFCLVVTGGFWVLVLPRMKEVTGERQQLDRQVSQVGSSAQSAKAPASLLAQKQETERLAMVLLPTVDNQYDLSIQIEALAKGLGLSLTSLAITPADSGTASGGTPTTTAAGTSAAQKSDPLKKLAVTVTVPGTYTDIQRFVTALGTIDRFLAVNQVTVTPTGTGNQVVGQITASAYYMADLNP